jgi:hypothetical protein
LLERLGVNRIAAWPDTGGRDVQRPAGSRSVRIARSNHQAILRTMGGCARVGKQPNRQRGHAPNGKLHRDGDGLVLFADARRSRQRFLNVATTRASGIVHANATRRDVPRAEPNRNLAA